MNEEWKIRAKIYDKLDWTIKQQYLSLLLRQCSLKSYSVVCDIGTGTGTVANALAKYCKKVYAIDKSNDMLDIAREKIHSEKIIFKVMNAENLNFKNNFFDCITARMVFHHIKNQNTAIKECFKKLKSNGICVISEGIPPQGTKNFYTKMFKLKEKRRTYTLDDLTQLLENGGFKDIDIKIHKMNQVSINNWLENSGLEDKVCKKIYNLHLDSSEYIKKAYNMNIIDGDIYMDWLFAIVSGVKKD